jgi:predicted RecA/RadA family phage recombinase
VVGAAVVAGGSVVVVFPSVVVGAAVDEVEAGSALFELPHAEARTARKARKARRVRRVFIC